jgi:hypothetical protein
MQTESEKISPKPRFEPVSLRQTDTLGIDNLRPDMHGYAQLPLISLANKLNSCIQVLF